MLSIKKSFVNFVVNTFEMETITIKINERSKAGKMVKDFLELISKNPGVEILEEKEEYNPAFVEKVLKSAASKNRTRVNSKNLWESI